MARDFIQQFGVDYTETFAPMVRMASVRFLLAAAVRNGLAVHLANAISAYLAGGLNEELYMELPEGYSGHDMVCQLLKSLYSLK